jgi:hypothetical protein
MSWHPDERASGAAGAGPGGTAVKFRRRNLEALADLVCGNLGTDQPGPGEELRYFPYRSSSYITEFFDELGTDFVHDGSTRHRWVADVLAEILAGPPGLSGVSELFARLIDQLMSPSDAYNEGPDRPMALRQLNDVLGREGLEAFYDADRSCYLRNTRTGTVAGPRAEPHRPLTQAEAARRDALASYLARCSEDELIEEVLLPLFRQLGFHRITAAGHRDKALEYGKDVWMRYRLPTQQYLYFGVQAKKGSIDAAGASRAGNANVAELHHQALMMLAHEIFDPETNRRVLVDHAFIVAGGRITKAARNWLGNALDASRRSQLLFLDRDDILNLHVVTNLPLPRDAGEAPAPVGWDEPPF